ncbi:group II intron reverse transcriptase/maturase [Caballeronia arationis]|jgi:RNA-directed DNA polymerase|uniref:Group II intron reverse transcriptase/maturase n=1 Tax=Caballeronia arationis TaxID=1777142 RepID=A0A7Z7IGL8_9BURK|nr:group II intron reverse transcriptase/maturase [Caballeronia arationis]SOE91335.1 group II intron reverse transcriptase/maturase [Caballeronia arationis]
MTVQQLGAGASSDRATHWHRIDWVKCHREVRRLQARIVKAEQAGKHSKVKSLQWLLTHSFSGKALAVKRVTGNRGKRTPGIDGVIWSTPGAKLRAVSSLNRHGYQPRPLRRIYIPKADGKKMRPLGIPCMIDRAWQALHLLALEPIAETTADPNSYGFRSARSTHDAIGQCFIALGGRACAQWILEADIRSCFDEISHDWLIANIPTDKAILRKWLKAGYLHNRVLHSTDAGTPQGGIISPLLMNMTLDGLERTLRVMFNRRGRNVSKINLVRYADDFVITGATREVLVDEVRPVVERFLAERGLSLSPEKTRITHIEDGFDFLGMNVRKYGRKLLIKPAKANVQRFLRKLRDIVKDNATVRHDWLIRKLNPLIRGWANYHRHVVSKRVFGKVSLEIWRCLWRWARRRHPNKGARWVRRKYFRTVDARHWVFGTETGKVPSTGAPELLALHDIANTPIRRHRKIKAAANPFDPQWESYFEERLGFEMMDSLKGRTRLIRLWWNQGRTCPTCSQPITKSSGWGLFHLERVIDGGTDASRNLVMLHPDCHQIARGQRFSVVKPAPATGLWKA